MRLLSKQEIDQKKAIEKQQTVQEGLKLAKNVDRLREVRADEEASLAAFREKTLKQIHEETEEARKERDSLKEEVRKLKKERQDALKPLTEEMALCEQKRRSNSEKHERLRKMELELDGRDSESAAIRRDAKLELERGETFKREAEKTLAAAEKAEHEQRLALSEARASKERAETLEKRVTKELTARDINIAARERDCTMKEERIAKERKELDAEWKRLDDRKQMFERTITRNK